ncbi:MAG: sodium:calcium antiporter [Candidatus Nealsonbacteria bacterium]|nr:sodium:calcium antiporter [Candidatus Nealsonbacteria bacterium]
MLWLYILFFLISCFLLILSGKWLIDALSRVAMILKLKEFVVAFFIMAVGTTIPNLIVGVVSALNGVPELSFGDVVGSNIFDLSLVMGLTALISKAGLSSNSRTVQGSSVFSIIIAVLPLILVLDGSLSRIDGVLLLLGFVIYGVWLFGKKERFTKVYDDSPSRINLNLLLKDAGIILVGIVLLFMGGQGVVKSATFFAQDLNLPIGLIGMFIVAIGTCLPETFFCLHAARKSQDWLILGNLMGNVVITATLVLGIVALIQPINIGSISYFAIARFFLLAAALFFFFFIKTSRKITKKEGLLLVGLYFAFIFTEIIVNIF